MQVVLDWELTEDEKNINVVRDALNVGGHGIPKKGIDDISFIEFKQWCKRKLKRNYRVVRQLKDELSNVEEEYARGGQEPDPSSFHEPEPSPFHKSDGFVVDEPQSRPFDGLNMFLVPQVSAKFGISPSSKLLTNLVLHLSKCVNLVLLTKFC